MADKRRQKKSDKKVHNIKKSSKKSPSIKEIAAGWQSFRPKMPLSYTWASLEAARRKNS